MKFTKFENLNDNEHQKNWNQKLFAKYEQMQKKFQITKIIKSIEIKKSKSRAN